MSQTAQFRELHRGERVLVLPNAWDAASARLVEECGAPAIATSSAALAWAHGYSDGEKLDPATMLSAVREIARVVRVPVSVDLEAGYGADPARLGDLVAAVVDAGGVGLNLEDGSGAPEVLAAKIAVVKQRAPELWINARTDVYLRNLAKGEAAVSESLRRAKIYRDAGADSLFVPGVVDAGEIAALVRGAQLPLNVLSRPTLPPVPELQRLGVRRLSVGCALAQLLWATARKATRELLTQGTFGALYADTISVAELNALFDRA